MRSGTPADVVRYLRDEFAAGRGEVFAFGPQADMQNSSQVIAYASQAGIALPERAYYLEDGKDGSYKRIRAAYVAHLAKQLRHAGVATADAGRQAELVLAFETRLAKASLSPVELRDPKNQYHFVTIAEADQATPQFPVGGVLRRAGRARRRLLAVAAEVLRRVRTRCSPTCRSRSGSAYLRFHAVDGASPYLSNAFEDENFAFYGQTLNGQKEQSRAGSACCRAMKGRSGKASGACTSPTRFRRRPRRAMETLVGESPRALKARIEKLDWMSAETKRKAIEKWQTFLPKIGYPDKWRDWSGLDIAPDDYFANVLARRASSNHDCRSRKIGKPVDRTEWTHDAADRQRVLQPAAERDRLPGRRSCSRRSSIPPPTTR